MWQDHKQQEQEGLIAVDSKSKLAISSLTSGNSIWQDGRQSESSLIKVMMMRLGVYSVFLV